MEKLKASYDEELTVIDLCDIPESSHLKKEVKRSIGFAS